MVRRWALASMSTRPGGWRTKQTAATPRGTGFERTRFVLVTLTMCLSFLVYSNFFFDATAPPPPKQSFQSPKQDPVPSKEEASAAGHRAPPSLKDQLPSRPLPASTVDATGTTAVFTPEEFVRGKADAYVNLPVLPPGVTPTENQANVERALRRKVDKPLGLLHEGHPPGHDVIAGLAAWPTAMGTFKTMVGSARNAGYDGHIILGVHSKNPLDEQEYLRQMDVTFYAVEVVPCEGSTSHKEEGNLVRGMCSKGLEHLKLEWGRFEMARQWLHACEKCTGWAMVMDTRDVFFQTDPFKGMPPPDSSPYDLLFIEEISKHTCPKEFGPQRYYTVGNSIFYRGYPNTCYGEWHVPLFVERPILCSGTIIGNRKGIDRFLAVFVEEFIASAKKEGSTCQETADQAILQWMYYTGKFADFGRTKTSPWGTGPVNTIGAPCVDNTIADPNKSHSAKDIVKFDESSGLILNNNENKGSAQYISPTVHQWDRCYSWIHPFFNEHHDLLFKTPVVEAGNAENITYK